MTRNHKYTLTKESWEAGSHYGYTVTEWTVTCECKWTYKTRNFDGWTKAYRQHTIDVVLKLLNIETGEQWAG